MVSASAREVRSSLGLGEGGAKLAQGLPARKNGNEEPIRPERPEALDHLPDRIVRPVQAHRMDDEIMGLRSQIQKVHIRHDDRIRAETGPEIREAGHDRGGCKRSVNLDQPFLDISAGDLVKEQGVIVGREVHCPFAVQGKG